MSEKHTLSPSGVTLFLPVLNEQDLIVPNTERLLAYLSRLNISSEILIGSNGSTDQTTSLGQELQHRYPAVRFFHLLEKGPGFAFRKAIDLMAYDRLITLDMDLPVPLDFISRSLELLKDHDIVIGSKKLGEEHRSVYRRMGSDLFIFCSRKLLGLPFEDYSLGAKAYRRTVLHRYRETIDRGTSYTERVICLAFHEGLRIVQIPVQCEDNRKSRFNLTQEAFYRFSRLFKLWILMKGKRFYHAGIS